MDATNQWENVEWENVEMRKRRMRKRRMWKNVENEFSFKNVEKNIKKEPPTPRPNLT